MLSWVNSPRNSGGNFVFLDRDGVINIDRQDYIKHWRELHFYPDALEALRLLFENRFHAILISNQSALNRGLIEWRDFWDLHCRMIRAIREAGGDLTAAFYCPHRPDENCSCRKPSPEMILTAAGIYGVSLEDAFMIGDRKTDVDAARRAGCRSILLDRSMESGALSVDFTLDEKSERHYTLLESACFLVDRAKEPAAKERKS